VEGEEQNMLVRRNKVMEGRRERGMSGDGCDTMQTSVKGDAGEEHVEI
jgi:hypothetical protein